MSEAAPAESGQAGIQLQRVDSPDICDPVFADDRDAWVYVVRRARDGSSLYRHALVLIDDIERCLIEGLNGSW